MKDTTRWNHSLSVRGDGKNIISHAGALLLRACADKTGLTTALARVLPSSTTNGWRDRAIALITLAGAIACGATNLLEAERLAAHHTPVLGSPASDSTLWRTLAALDETAHAQIAKARAKIRRHVWTRLHLRPTGFPWLNVAGKHLKGWIVLDLDATIVTASSDKQGARGTFKRTYGHHPLAAWCANTCESLTTLLRKGNAGSNTVGDHIRVMGAALAQIPGQASAKLLIRIDGAGATHALLEYLEGLATTRRTVRYTVGWTITGADETAIAHLPESAWASALNPDGTVREQVHVAELTGLNTRPGWPEGLRLIVRRVRPSVRDAKKLTALEKRTGWRYAITATNIGRMHRVAGSHHPQFLDAVHRTHAVVEDRVRTNKAMGLDNLPSSRWDVNVGWVLAASLAADLDAWVRLLGCHDDEVLARAEPVTMRHRLYHVPATLARHARRRVVRIDRTWPYKGAFTTCWDRLQAIPAPT